MTNTPPRAVMIIKNNMDEYAKEYDLNCKDKELHTLFNEARNWGIRSIKLCKAWAYYQWDNYNPPSIGGNEGSLDSGEDESPWQQYAIRCMEDYEG